MQEFLKIRRSEIADICRIHHVRQLAVFGSAVRSDFDPESSDVDLLVEFDPISPEEYFDNKRMLRERLTSILSRRVDMTTWKSVRNPYLRREIEATRELLYAA